MKKYLTILFFTVFLVAGFLLGSWAGVLRGHSQSETSNEPIVGSPSDSAFSSTSNEQVNFLLIQVDRLDSPSPTLQSLWVVIDSPHTKYWMFVPIDPSLAPANGSLTFESTFKLDANNQLDPLFIDLLNQDGYQDAAYLIYDQAWVSEFVELVAAAEEQRGDSDGATELRNVIHRQTTPGKVPQGNRLEMNQEQTEIWRLLCQSFSDPVQSIKPEELMVRLGQHIRASLSRDQMLAAIKKYASNPMPIYCTFPALGQAVP